MVDPATNGHDAPPHPAEDDHHPDPDDDEPPPQRSPGRLRRFTRRHRRASLFILLALIVLVLLAAALILHHLYKYESTDDAQIDAHIATISARVPGTVLRVFVEDHTPVRAGTALVQLDPRDFEVAVAQAEAQLLQAQSELAGAHPQLPMTALTTETQTSTATRDVTVARAVVAVAQRDLDAAHAQVASARANSVKASADLSRARYLLREKAIPPETLDARLAAARMAASDVDSATARARSAERNVTQAREHLREAELHSNEVTRNAPRQLDIQRATVGARTAAVKAAQAALDKARLDLSYTRVVAPFDGIVGKRNVEPGDHVGAGQELMALVDISHPWVTANFKETQLRKMRPGQPVRIHVDSLGRDFRGTVESFPAATGARFSLLPPENATGNYVKVVQRLPVRIRFDGDQQLQALRPGMSVEPRVTVR